MHSPQHTLSEAVDRASEITWWNREMTKINQISGIDNAVEFTESELIEQKGPYIELVEAPEAHSETASAFLDQLGYDSRIADAVTTELFGGSQGSLYQHQAETIDAIERTDRDTILSVPTAAGKTEAFFLPILNHCLSTDASGLKSIVLYPMKTLTVDQLNRFLTYLNHINREQPPDDRITIGIWDGDTPHAVGSRDYEIEAGSYIRGLECPESGEKLRIMSTNTVGTDQHTYSWIKTTRESIKQGVDILLTNPEAIDYMFVNDSADTRQILGSRPGEHPVKHIVYDEAHVWSGISGAGISLLSQRLKHFYGASDPQVTMVSATVDNPEELATALTGTGDEPVNAIDFTPRSLASPSDVDFSRLKRCSLDNLVEGLARAEHGLLTAETLDGEASHLQQPVETLAAVGLVQRTGDQVEPVPNQSEWTTEPLDDTISKLVREGEFDDAPAVIRSEEGRDELLDALLDAGGYDTAWFEFVLEAIPEVRRLADWFETDTTGSVGFKQYSELLSNIDEFGVDDPEETLTTVLTFGRLAGVVTEKYHAFLRPPKKVHWCQECRLVSRTNACRECGESIRELQFCRRCHQPYFEASVEPDEETDTDNESKEFIPVGHTEPVDSCPGCEQYVNLTDIEVPTPTMLSFMLTEVCRTAPSKKTLVFSDSHASAESVGSEIMGTEYGLMAESLYVKELLDNDGVVDNQEAFHRVSDTLREAYYDPLYQNEVDEDSETYNLLRQMRSEITGNAMLRSCRHLFTSGLIVPESLYQHARDDPDQLIIGHEIYTLFAEGGIPGFDKETASIEGLTREKICDRLERRLTYQRNTIESHVDDLLAVLLHDRTIQEQSWDDVRAAVNESNIGQERLDTVFDYIEAQRDHLNTLDAYDQTFDSGVFTRIAKEDTSDLRLVPRVAYCTDCYSAHPVAEGETVTSCRSCGATVETKTRFEVASDGSYSGQGYAAIDSEWKWPLDHWAYEIARPLTDGEPEFITVGIHKGNIPPTLRGAIEESFRKDNPGVNIVSATPTMELGVDIGTLETVTQVGVPPTLTNYVQRSGRTGRTRGSSSLVMTVIRGDHPVDNHYYANLEGFFSEFEPVRVPDPYDFDEVLAGHVVTVVAGYLARNPHESNIFEKFYTLSESKTDLQSYVHEVTDRLTMICEFVEEEMADELRAYLSDVFGPRGVKIFEQVFFEDGPLSIPHRTEQTFSQLAAMSGSTETNKRLTERHNRLDSWLGLLGYLANYRDFGQSFPVKFSGRQDSIEFESTGRLYDMFPGEENDVGSVITLSGTKYIVDDVHGTSTPLTEVTLCTNDECNRPFTPHTDTDGHCPHCGEELTETPIHDIASVECRAARGGEKGYNTRGIMSTEIVDPAPEDSNTTTSSGELFGLDYEATQGGFTVTDFVYAFERGHSQSPDRTTLRSEAVIEQAESKAGGGGSWREKVDQVTEETYAPVGQRYHTKGLKLSFSQSAVASRLEALDREIDDHLWTQLLASLEQAVTKAVAIIAEADQQDFRINTRLTDDAVEVLLVDSRQGGNGITWQVKQELESDFPHHIADVVSCTKCVDYCEECLLLARTDPAYLENQLLDKFTLRAAIGSLQDA